MPGGAGSRSSKKPKRIPERRRRTAAGVNNSPEGASNVSPNWGRDKNQRQSAARAQP